MERGAYDYRNCQSLFGYAAQVHERSGGVCQLCGAGAARLDFELWRQLTVEHLIGDSQGGYLRQIRSALMERYPELADDDVGELARRIDEANTITACSFCNATTSRNHVPISMTEAITGAPDGDPDVIFDHVTRGLAAVLDAKRADVAWKLRSVRSQFESHVAPHLADRRARGSDVATGRIDAADVGLVADRVRSDVVVSKDDFVTPPGYSEISLALVDAVFSIRTRYEGVRRVVKVFAAATGLPDAGLSSAGEHGLQPLIEAAERKMSTPVRHLSLETIESLPRSRRAC